MLSRKWYSFDYRSRVIRFVHFMNTKLRPCNFAARHFMDLGSMSVLYHFAAMVLTYIFLVFSWIRLYSMSHMICTPLCCGLLWCGHKIYIFYSCVLHLHLPTSLRVTSLASGPVTLPLRIWVNRPCPNDKKAQQRTSRAPVSLDIQHFTIFRFRLHT